MEFIISKMLLPFILATIAAFMKVGMAKWTPSIYEKMPKQIWLGIIPALAEASAQWSPELFVFPGFPAWASTLFYTTMTLGAREFLTQISKAMSGDTSPSKPMLMTGSPTGI